jgi:hypothetical protein
VFPSATNPNQSQISRSEMNLNFSMQPIQVTHKFSEQEDTHSFRHECACRSEMNLNFSLRPILINHKFSEQGMYSFLYKMHLWIGNEV